MDESEIDQMLEHVRVERERLAIPVNGSIRRSPVSGTEGWLRTDVWDDEFFTTLRVLDGEPRADLIQSLFLARKAKEWN